MKKVVYRLVKKIWPTKDAFFYQLVKPAKIFFQEAEAGRITSPIVYGDDHFYFGTERGLCCLQRKNFKFTWFAETGKVRVLSVVDDKVFALGRQVSVVNQETGAVQWQQSSRGALALKGSVLYSNKAGNLVLTNLISGQESSPLCPKNGSNSF